MPEVESAFAFGQNVHVVLKREDARVSVEQKLSECGIAQTLQPTEATIEDCFMDLMVSVK